MAEPIKAVTEPEGDPKKGKKRARSGVSFPYYDMGKSIEVAETMHHRAGGRCSLAQLATLLGYSGVRNGSFRTRVSAAKMFGFIEDADGDDLRVSPRGRTIVAPISDDAATTARVDAFLAIELFKKVFEQFHGTTLPQEVGLRNLIETQYGVVPDRVVPTVRIMLDSADQAGLFATAGNRTRMVRPLGARRDENPAGSRQKDTPRQDDAGSGDKHGSNGSGRSSGGGGSGNGGGGSYGDIDPAFIGLLRRLPEAGQPLDAKRRNAVVEAFKNTVDFLYPEQSD
jgi:uncharacterized membrane protein YgcG